MSYYFHTFFSYCTWPGCYSTLREEKTTYCPAHKEIFDFSTKEKLKIKELPPPRVLEEPDVNWNTIMDTSSVIQKLLGGDLDVEAEKLYKQAKL